MNRVDVVDLVVDLVDVDLDVDLVDVVSLSSGCIFIFWPLGPRLYFNVWPQAVFEFLAPAVPAVFFPGCIFPWLYFNFWLRLFQLLACGPPNPPASLGGLRPSDPPTYRRRNMHVL